MLECVEICFPWCWPEKVLLIIFADFPFFILHTIDYSLVSWWRLLEFIEGLHQLPWWSYRVPPVPACAALYYPGSCSIHISFFSVSLSGSGFLIVVFLIELLFCLVIWISLLRFVCLESCYSCSCSARTLKEDLEILEYMFADAMREAVFWVGLFPHHISAVDYFRCVRVKLQDTEAFWIYYFPNSLLHSARTRSHWCMFVSNNLKLINEKTYCSM